MDIDIENKFVEKFIVKNRQERIKYELNNPKRRRFCLERFAHDTDELIIEKNIVFRGDKMTLEEAEKAIFKLTGSKSCYYLSENQEDSRYEPLHECLGKWYYSGPSVFICSENAAFIVTEYCAGSSEKFLLQAK